MSIHWWRTGFDPGRMGFALRTAFACGVALMLAWLMGLEHPQWAGMSVWAASQPLRGQLLEKSLFRFAGTVSGTVVGVLLVMALQIHPALLVAGLALWVGACTWIGNLQRGLIAYGTVLAGYTASMVALLDTAHPGQVLLLGSDRMATVLTGVAVATLVGYFFAQRSDQADLRARIRLLLADLLRYLADPEKSTHGAAPLLKRLAAIEEGLETHAAGSLRSRREMRAIRAVLMAAVPLLLCRDEGAAPDAEAAEALQAAVRALEQGHLDSTRELLGQAAIPGLAALAVALQSWQAHAATDTQPGRAASTAPREPSMQVLHRDWIGAREAGLRAGLGMLLFGAIWQLSGWSAGAYMLLGLSVMISLFSTFDSPAVMMRHVFTGQVLGVCAAIACRWLFWPHAETAWQQILLLYPFILVGAVLVAHRDTVAEGMDFNMVFLLMSQPHIPLTGSPQDSITMGLAVLAGPLLAWAGYLLVFPINLQRRQQHVLAMMRRDLIDLASNPNALAQRLLWQVRIHHRILRLIRISEHLARAETKAQASSRAAYQLAQAALRCHALLHAVDTAPATSRRARLALDRIVRIEADPERAAGALLRLAQRLDGRDARLMRQAADGVVGIA